MSPHAVLGFLLLLAFAGTMPAQDPSFTFTIDRAKAGLTVVSQNGEPGTPRAGDLVDFKDRLWLRLDEPGDHAFTDRWSRGTVERDGVVVAVDEAALLGLGEVKRRALRGVRLTAWNERIAAAVWSLPSGVPLTLTQGTAIDGRVPQLPSGTQHLWLRDTGPRFDPHHSATLPELRTLRADGSPGSSLDLTPFVDARHLRWLHVCNVTLCDGASLLRFTQLRTFVGDHVDVDASWLTMAKELRRFEMHDGEVRSLEALAVLPNLTEIVIDRRRIGTRRRENAPAVVALPVSRFPRLRRLELQDTGVSVEEARAFRRVNPGCRIFGAALPEQYFETALATADRIVLDGRFQQPRFETTDAKTVRNVAAMFASLIDAEPRPYERPEAVLEFFAGTARLTRIEICGAFLTVTDCECPGCFRLEIDVCRQLNGWLRSIPRAAR